MKALILNSGMGTRMGDETKSHPKCMTFINSKETILSRQLKQLKKCNINNVIITTGYLSDILESYCRELSLDINYTFIHNDKFETTNYIYSILLALDALNEDFILMHGDLVFDTTVLKDMLRKKESCMAVDFKAPLPENDFKAVIKNNLIEKVGINFFDNAVAAQPLYKINCEDWKHWADKIQMFCEEDNVKCYAENAFNEVSDLCIIYPFDVDERLCREVDSLDDLADIKNFL